MNSREIEVLKFEDGRCNRMNDVVIREAAVTLFLNDEELATLVCTPQNLKELAVGFLCAEGILSKPEQLTGIKINEEDGLIWVEVAGNASGATFGKRYITTCCGRGRPSFYFVNDASGIEKITSELTLTPRQILNLSDQLEGGSKLFRATGGAHAAALCSGEEVIYFYEDVGRHNAVDKIFGRCFLDNVPRNDKVMAFSGRVSAEILIKVARMQIPAIISRSAPTDLAVELAGQLGVTVVSFARGNRFNVYTYPERIKF